MAIRLKFAKQDFQERAAKSICDLFNGQGSERFSFTGRNEGEIFTFTAFGNREIIIDDAQILANLRKVQESNNLPQSDSLAGKNFTVEMETGTGKTYTYIRTIYELNKLYGWSKFIIIVPSIAIREGVYKTFAITQEHFKADYTQPINYFIYDSAKTGQIRQFVEDSNLQAMIINSQAFNARDENSRLIHKNIDKFGGRRPIDAISSVRPIIIIDEPQSVEGVKTREGIKDFNPLFILRYSATPREKYNLVYKLGAGEALDKNLVKKIAVTGFTFTNIAAGSGYVYLRGIIKSEHDPAAMIEFDRMTQSGLQRLTRKLNEGANLFELSGHLDEYKNGYIIRMIDGLNNSIEFLNGVKLSEGEITGNLNEDELRRIQIRETIETHLRREKILYSRGIKVLSLFFIDEVAKYRKYNDDGEYNGIYAKIFEEEYNKAVKNFENQDSAYSGYLASIKAESTHAGYFSIDKNNRMTDGKINKKEGTSDDISAFDLIMRDKERLLNLGEPVRFIFSHSALREGWDNPNVFQICALKNSTSDIRRRQEIGRGLRLPVNQDGTRIIDGEINLLTVIASESYKNFAEGLQSEFRENNEDSPRIANTREQQKITLNRERFESPEFRELWRRINRKSIYFVNLNESAFIKDSARKINDLLQISRVHVKIERGNMDSNFNFTEGDSKYITLENFSAFTKYDLVGKLARQTELSRKIIVDILKSINPEKLELFALNPENFIAQTIILINEQKSIMSADNIKYEAIDEFDEIDSEIFDSLEREKFANESEIAETRKRGLYDYAICDSGIEKDFAGEIDSSENVSVHLKLPGNFAIETPTGKYNPDWAAVIDEKFSVIETKGSARNQDLRGIENIKISCAKNILNRWELNIMLRQLFRRL
ncbi:MAG: DEAD/DEAH box helicase family protein [Synergistaceae bacterium]|nr:DEAD/DEAH box helicase family protein [Synergistaceae bacterium]